MCWDDSFEHEWAMWQFQSEPLYPGTPRETTAVREARAAVAEATTLLRSSRLKHPASLLAPIVAWLNRRKSLGLSDRESAELVEARSR